MLADAIERAGVQIQVKIKDAISRNERFKPCYWSMYTIDENHNPIKSATILEYKDGKQVFNTKVNP